MWTKCTNLTCGSIVDAAVGVMWKLYGEVAALRSVLASVPPMYVGSRKKTGDDLYTRLRKQISFYGWP